MEKIIAIDFDGTITLWSPYPIMGKLREDAAKYIKKLYEDGYTLVLWTCRVDDYFEEAIKLLKDNDLYKYFKYFNEDGFSKAKKIVASYYIDDRSVPGELNWEETYNYIRDYI